MTAVSRFGGRLIWADHFLGNGGVDSATSWYVYNETQAAFTIIRGAAGTTLGMGAAATAGSYLDGQALRVAPVAGSPNMELLLKFTAETGVENLPGIWARGDGTFTTPLAAYDATCYFVEVASAANQLQIARNVAGTGALVGAPVGSTWTNLTDTFLRFAVIGSNLFAKAWPASNPEPGWQVQLTDTTITSGNRFGFGLHGGNSGTTPYELIVKDFWAWDLSAVPVSAIRVVDEVGPVTGTLARTLANVTSTASAVSGANGTVARTLANTVSATAGIVAVTGTLARTLGNVTVAAVGGSSTSGSLAETLDSAVVQSAGAVGVSGTLTRTLANATVVGVGAFGGGPGVTGTVAVTLDSVEVCSPLTDNAGVPILDGVGFPILDENGLPILDEDGQPLLDDSGNPILVRGAEGIHGLGGGALDVTLDPVTLTASGQTGFVNGSVARTLAAVTVVAGGGHGVAGPLTKTLANVTSAAVGTVGVTGTVTVTLGNTTSAASGTSTPIGVAGNLGLTLAAVVSAAVGSSTGGELAETLADVVCVASGTADLAPVTGTVDAVLADVTSTAGGVTGATGTVDRTLGDVTADSVGAGVAGTVNETLADVTSTAVGSGSLIDFQGVTFRERGFAVTVRN